MSQVEQFRGLKRIPGEIPVDKLIRDLSQGYVVGWTNTEISAQRQIHKVINRHQEWYFRIELSNISFALETFHQPGASFSIALTRDPFSGRANSAFTFIDEENGDGKAHFWSEDKSMEESDFWRLFGESQVDIDATTQAYERDVAKTPQETPFEIRIAWLGHSAPVV